MDRFQDHCLLFLKHSFQLCDLLGFIIYLQSECIKKYQFELCSKYGKEHDFDVMLGLVVPCRKLKWICMWQAFR